MKFTKMHGCGNDYIYINGFEETVENPIALAIEMSERHFGVGSDGLVLILPSEKADFRMRMFNLDGSEGEMCGNAIRCIGKYVYERGMTQKTQISVDTLGGIKYLDLMVSGDEVISVRVDMGEPILRGREIPMDVDSEKVMGLSVHIEDRDFALTCVSMGNPHAVAFIEDVDGFDVQRYGSQIEGHKLFPKKTNTEFVEVVDRGHIKMRVWERGSGETLACGTGTCACVVASILNGYCDREVEVSLLGGTIHVYWSEEDNHVYMTGPAAFSFDGVWLRGDAR